MKKFESLTFLVIDDSKVTRSIISSELGKCGIENILEAGDGIEALRKLELFPNVGMILCDINMPNMNGIEFLQALQTKTTLKKDIPIIMITTESCKDSVIKAIALGAKNYIVKPFDRHTLVDKIRNTAPC